jgi:hypothetical protein
MSDAENCVGLLNKMVEENFFVQRTIDGFWDSFSNYKREEPEEYRDIFGDEDDIVEIDYMKLSLVLHDKQPSYSHVFLSVSYNIYFKKKEIGYYKMVFSLDGEVVDDILHFD